MSQFESLKHLYKQLESEGVKPHGEYIISTVFRAFVNKREQDKTDDDKSARWEFEYFSLPLYDNKLGYRTQQTDKKGNVIPFPDVLNFSIEQFDYLKRRQEEAQHPTLKARYSHLLWLSPAPHKHAKYAEQAIKSYIELAERMMADAASRRDFDVLNHLKNALLVSISARRMESEISDVIRRITADEAVSDFLRFSLIQLAVDYPDSFFNVDFTKFGEVMNTIFARTLQNGEHSWIVDQSKLGERISMKLKSNNSIWLRRRAAAYEEMIALKKDAGIVSTEFCLSAIGIYKQLKDREKVSQLEKKYSELQKEIKLGTISQEFNITEYVKLYRQMADNLCKESADTVLQALMTDSMVIPTEAEIDKINGQTSEASPFWLFCTLKTIDVNSHTSEQFSTDEQRRYFKLLQDYSWVLKLFKIHLIREILLTAVMQQRLTLSNVVTFLRDRAWFGKDLPKTGGEAHEVYNWLGVIAPAINEYFVQIECAFLYPGYRPNFVLCIDSLTVKIEGLLRDLCRYSGGTSWYIKTENGKKFVREMPIEGLLYEKTIVKLLGKDDLLFLRFLLVEQAGYNLRHKVAHSMLYYENYGIHTMNLLFVALLKLAKYDFVREDAKTAT